MQFCIATRFNRPAFSPGAAVLCLRPTLQRQSLDRSSNWLAQQATQQKGPGKAALTRVFPTPFDLTGTQKPDYSGFALLTSFFQKLFICLSEFALARSFGLLFPLYRRLLVMLSFANFRDNSRLCTRSFKSSERAVQRFVIFYTNFCHCIPSLCHTDRGVI